MQYGEYLPVGRVGRKKAKLGCLQINKDKGKMKIQIRKDWDHLVLSK